MRKSFAEERRSRHATARKDAAFVLQREVERQDACGYRDWERLVDAITGFSGFLDLRP